MFKKVVAIASVTVLLAASPAFAHDGYRHGGGHYGYQHEHSDRGPNGALIALGAFAAFAGVAAILSAQHEAPPPAYPAPAYYAPAPTYYAPGYYPSPAYTVDNR
ncbi:MAG: hypothetical protein HY060_04470 [Proteobacteria bacterium]|nr:hypothetical protein [Pseudomonadota bacterium]